MGKVTKVTCDSCDRDITYTGNCIDYRLVIMNQSIPAYPKANAITAMGMYPHINEDVYFCNARCLKQWVLENIYKDDV